MNFNVVKIKDKGLGETPDSYVSKIGDNYISFIWLENDVKFLLRKGIMEQLQNSFNIKNHIVNIGFNPEKQKWYGWSHRAINGFCIGSGFKKGEVQYQPGTKEAFKEDCLRFWGDTNMEKTHKVKPVAKEGMQAGKLGIWVLYTYDDKTPNKNLRNKICGVFSPYPEKFGKGEWTAKTLEDAKQMAIDFADGIS